MTRVFGARRPGPWSTRQRSALPSPPSGHPGRLSHPARIIDGFSARSDFMRTIIRSAVRGLVPAMAASTLGLALSGHAGAAPPIPALILAAAIGQSQYGTVKGRLVWGGDQVPPVKVLQE